MRTCARVFVAAFEFVGFLAEQIAPNTALDEHEHAQQLRLPLVALLSQHNHVQEPTPHKVTQFRQSEHKPMYQNISH